MTLRRAALLLLALALLGPARAQDNRDVAAATRAVVRVLLAGSEGEEAYLLGGGSGFAVAPNMIVTNAHVVEALIEGEAEYVGIVPSEGKESFGGKLVAYEPERDLALIRLVEGRVSPATIFPGAVPDGAAVSALGYPLNVDRAQGLAIEDLLNPMSPVKSRGEVSGGRSARQFDTVLHTAAIAMGSSGGPLVDECGRVIGVNSFLSLSDGSEAEFAFAVSTRELMQFLRRAGVKPATTDARCLSAAEQLELERRLAGEDARSSEGERERLGRLAEERAARRIAIERETAAGRENAIAIAAVLLVLAALAAAGGGWLLTQQRRPPGYWTLGGAAAIALAALAVFVNRPGYAEAEARLATEFADAPRPEAAATVSGALSCTIDRDRSRVTVSDTADVALDWQAGGCVNRKTQYGDGGGGIWSRAFVPEREAVVTVQSYEPARARYTVERFLLSAEEMTRARGVRQSFQNKSCTTDATALASVADMQGAIRAVLPPRANERLVFACKAAG